MAKTQPSQSPQQPNFVNAQTTENASPQPPTQAIFGGGPACPVDRSTFSSALSSVSNFVSSTAQDLRHASVVVDRIVEAGIDITADYDDWVNCGFALSELGEEGRRLFHRISTAHSGYTFEECEAKYTNCLNTRNAQHNPGARSITLASFFRCASDHGIDISLPEELKRRPGRPRKDASRAAEGGEEKVSLMQQIEDILSSMAVFQYNVVTCSVEMRALDDHGVSSNNWERMNDRELDTMYTRIKKLCPKAKKDDVRSIINSRDFSHDFNPFVDYFEKLPAWDGETNYIEQFFDTIQFETPDDRDFDMPLLTKWFVRAVALMVGIVDDNQIMPVFIGKANVGKTYFAKHILPPELLPYSQVVVPGERFDKDQLIAMSEKALILFDEFSLDAKLSGTIKAILSCSNSDQRAAYAHYREQRSRKASFVGTGNYEQYQPEREGNRRYLTVKVKGIRHFDDNEHPLPYSEAYAQAYALARAGAQNYTFSYEDALAISQRNEESLIPNLCEELILKHLRVPGAGEVGVMMTTTDITALLLSDVRSPEINNTNVGRALKHLGFEKKRKGNGMYYYVFKIESGEYDGNAIAMGNEFFREQQSVSDGSAIQYSFDDEDDAVEADTDLLPF